LGRWKRFSGVEVCFFGRRDSCLFSLLPIAHHLSSLLRYTLLLRDFFVVQRISSLKLLHLSFLKILSFLESLVGAVTCASLTELLGRPEYSPTIVLIALLEVKDVALLIVLLFSVKSLAKPVIFVVKQVVLRGKVVKQSRHLFSFRRQPIDSRV
jgi:hypothetical protein